ncbi:MAG: glycosyltransferase family 1 protein [Candidatus Roizmanbacteria bacterium]|nr:glycosyltransferase family 1 protein [Candidatus Roizmanbacteria bacterium]
MRIGINGYYLTTQTAGIGQYTINLLRALGDVDKINKYYVFVPQKVEWDLPDNFKLKVISPTFLFPKTFINRFIWEEYQLGFAIKKYKIDVFHGMYQSLPLGSEKIGNVVTIHDAIPWRFPFERKQRLYRWYSDSRKELVTKRAKKIITISETSKIDFASIYEIKPETIEVTYESIDPIFHSKFTPKEIQDFKQRYDINRKYILYTGGLKRHKNLRMLIKSFAILVQDHGFEGDLYILGAKRSTMAVSPFIYYKVEDLEKYAKMKKIGSRVKFVGFISRKDMALFMHESKVFVSLSLYEGFGLPAVEAMASGCPSVLSNLGAYPEIAQDAALFVYPYGPHRIAEAVDSILTKPELRDDLSKKGLRRAKFFNRISIAERVLEVYKEVYDDYKVSFQP